MARKRKRRNLAKTAAALVATALLEKAIQKAAQDPRIRRKAKAVAEALVKRAQAARKKITKVIRKRAPKVARAKRPKRKKAVTA
jgi:hypothetical protein